MHLLVVLHSCRLLLVPLGFCELLLLQHLIELVLLVLMLLLLLVGGGLLLLLLLLILLLNRRLVSLLGLRLGHS